MNKRIEAIEEYLKYFPNDGKANSNLLLCQYADELDIELSNEYSYYPRVDYGMFQVNEQIVACKRYYLTSSTTNYEQNNEDTLVVWKESCGRYMLVGRNEHWCLIEDEWNELISILKSYNPLDYDELNNVYVYDVENGKKLINDYDEIIKGIKDKVDKKIKKKELEDKIHEYKKMLEELKSMGALRKIN